MKVYVKRCIGSDTFMPISQKCSNRTGLGESALAALPTAILFGFADEQEKLSNWVKRSFTCKKDAYLNVRDVITGPIASLISAYSLTGDVDFLKLAEECGLSLLPAFANPIPYPFVNGLTGTVRSNPVIGGTSIAEASGFILEFQLLSRHTKNPLFKNAVRAFLKHVAHHASSFGGIPSFWDPGTGLNRTSDNKLSQYTAGFYANVARLFMTKKGPEITQILDLLVKTYHSTNLKELLMPFGAKKPYIDQQVCSLPGPWFLL